MRAAELLAPYSYNSLRTIARTRGLGFERLRRAELLAALAESLLDPGALEDALAELSPHERAVLEEVARLGGRASIRELSEAAAEHGIEQSAPARPRESLDRIAPDTHRFDEICARLTAHGLLFSETEVRGPLAAPVNLNPGPTLVAPSAVLRALVTRPSPEVSPGQAAPDVAAQEPRPEPAHGRLIVQPSFALLLLPPFDEATRSRLDSIAEPVRIGETGEWRLTQARWHAALERGASSGELIAWLTERGGAALPQNVRYSLDEWTRLGEQVTLWQTAAVLVGPADHLDRLQAQPELQALVITRAAPDRLVLRNPGLAARIVAAGPDVQPFLRRYDHPVTPAQMIVDADGTITLIRRGASSAGNLVLPITLDRFCRPLADGRFQLDQERFRQAVAQMPDGVTGILQFLRANAHVIPPEVVTRLRLWADPTPLAVDRPVLLRLRPEQLETLRADPELAPLLQRHYAAGEALVEIDDEVAVRLRTLLGARGIDI